MKKYMLYAVALLLTGAVMTACSGSEDITGNTTPEPQTPTVKGAVMLKGTIGGKDATTRTIADDGKGTWSEGDQLAIYYQTTSGYSTAVATVNSINTNGSATFTAMLYSPKVGNSNVSIVYPTSAHNGQGGIKTDALAEQDGTLAGINSNGLDIEKATATLNIEEQPGQDAKATLSSDVNMVPQVCLYTMNLKKDANTDLSATKLEISDGTNSYTISSSTATTSFTVALLPVSNANLTFAATSTESGLTYTKLSVTLANCTLANVGDIIDKYGDIYKVFNGTGLIYGASFTGKTLEAGKFYTSNLTLSAGGDSAPMPVAMIAYVGDAGSVETGTEYRGLAIAMQDCNKDNTDTDYWYSTTNLTRWNNNQTTKCTPHQGTVAEAREWLDGISITNTLVNETNHNHSAAKAAANYQYDPSNPTAALPTCLSNWFLPSLGQWQLMIQGLVTKQDNLSTLYDTPIEYYPTNNDKMKSSYFNPIFTNAGAGQLDNTLASRGYWSSSECSVAGDTHQNDKSSAWRVMFQSGYVTWLEKTYGQHTLVRAALAF